jgi:mRNA-degrading endonuclease RelE of RelBE toxin-antitoxin system
VREQFVKGYRLLYRVEEQRILVLAVVHGKRSPDYLTDRLQ